MKSLTSTERGGKALIISTVALIAVVFLFLSYLIATQHRMQRMQDIYYGVEDSVSVALSAYEDSLKTIDETAEVSYAADEFVAGTIDKILGNISFFETVSYFLIILCIFILVCFVTGIFLEWLRNRRKSSFADLSQQRAKILNEDLLDPIGLCKSIDKRIKQSKNKSDRSDRFALDYLYLSRNGIIKPRNKSAYQKAFLESLISNSQFSEKVNEVEGILDNKNLPDPLNYRIKFSELEGVFKRFAVIKKDLITDDTVKPSENDRKSE